MSKSTNLTFIGSIRALIADGKQIAFVTQHPEGCLLYTSPSPRDQRGSRMPSSA